MTKKPYVKPKILGSTGKVTMAGAGCPASAGTNMNWCRC